MRLEPFSLTGSVVQLEPLRRSHVAAIIEASSADPSSYGYTQVPDNVASAEAYVDGLLADADRDMVVPFAQRRLADDRVVGCTRFLNVTWWPGRPWPVEVEIGGTWLSADAQRSPINTEAKLLLLTHAFEVWGVNRVAICTDALNAHSRRAIERLGAQFEGVLRRHRAAMGHASVAGSARDTAAYSIIPDEWPAVRQRLAAMRSQRAQD